ncbi:putative glucan endo-1,3-beta-D-glucosidase [Medicago truncatula]|uniref:glucan endo-1,3-beta-D-glucosidase n=1 Tax=Medicago truncatula TaxID=3880 RepID=G7JAB8_MEDTR|nr:glucan endo-1,3-beta-glucosidase 5 [Medicago truncatula]AES72750.1 glucan endo-1,3-beta-glucosidase-like protein [Medicago truncatula]RHN69859.1 putative glucan endo-1,3-beta-D-glucosidase [Medicago truncatula]
MAGAEFSIGALCLIVLLAYGTLHCVQGADSIPGLGINWGALASNPMDPNIVANMLKDNGIKKVKLFDADPWIVSAFSGDFEVMVGIPNDQLSKFAGSLGDAEDWVKENLTKHLHNGGVNIRYVAVGNEPFLTSYGDKYVKKTFPAMQNIQKAIDKAGHGEVKVTTALNADVYESQTNKPSDGDFRDNIRDVMKQIIQFLHEKKSPFLVNIYPFLSLYQSEGFPEDFAFFGTHSMTISDKNAQYSNVFDANLDTLAWALKKSGYSDIKIVVGEIGWPTDGNKNANVNNAKRFYQGFLKNMASKKGTPMLPGHMDAYLFSLFDENLKSIDPGNFERHWGIYRYDGKPKFPIDFSGKGEEKLPQSAKGVRYQEHKWCVLNADVKNMSLIPPALDYACAGADCTSLGYGCSCGNLGLAGNASFAFNQFFQTRDQSVEACDFNGLGSIVTQDPSKGTCLFPIELESNNGDMLTTMRIMASMLIGLSIFFITL